MRLPMILFLMFISLNAQCYEGPDPLKGIKVDFNLTKSFNERYFYRYEIKNPRSNDGSIRDVNIFLGIDPEKDVSSELQDYSHCKRFFKYSSSKNFKERPAVAVGSTGPVTWACGYAILYGESEIAYRWGSLDNQSYISPGKSQTFSLQSEGLPGIRRIMIDPNIELQRLPEEYNGNIEKTDALEKKVRWEGKTVGPQASPKVFDPTKFIQYIESLLEESSKLGWVKIRGIENSLNKQLRAAEKLIGKGGNHPTQKIMEAFLKEVKKFKKRHLSSEAYALLYYNGQYFLDHLEVKNDHKDHHDKDHGHHHDEGKHHGRDDHQHDGDSHHDHGEGHHQHGKKDRHNGHRGGHRGDDHHNHKNSHDKYRHDNQRGGGEYHRRK